MKTLSPIDQYIWNPVFEAEKIQTFGETPVPETKVKDYNKAEDTVEEEEKKHREKDREDLEEQRQEQETEESEDMNMEEEGELPEMCKRLLEYGTPAGVNSSGGCKSCGCEDAGDAAIIDAEIEESEGSDKKKEQQESSGEPSGPAQPFGAPTEPMFSLSDPAIESLGEQIGGLFTTLGIIAKKLAHFGHRVYIGVRNLVSDNFMRISTVQKLWDSRINSVIPRLTNEDLQTRRIEAFNRETWCTICSYVNGLYDLVGNGEQLVFDQDTKTMTAATETIVRKLAEWGVYLKPERQTVDVDKLLDSRRYLSLTELGFTTEYMPVVMRYFGELAKRVPSASDRKLEMVLNRINSKVTNMNLMLNDTVHQDKSQQRTEQYKEDAMRIAEASYRLNFLLTAMRCCYILMDRLTKDIKTVCKQYEQLANAKD